jgi:hypothetical protein
MSAEIISSPDQGSDQSPAPLVPLLLPVAAEHVIRLIRTKVAASLAERRAIPPFVALIEEPGNTATTEFAAKWRAGIREDLGPEIAGRLIALHMATLGAISAMREDNPKEQQQLPADSDIQADWARAGAVMQAQSQADGVTAGRGPREPAAISAAQYLDIGRRPSYPGAASCRAGDRVHRRRSVDGYGIEPVPERPFTVKSAAEHLECSEANVRNLCRAGKLGHFRVGCSQHDKGPIRIPASAMREYIERCSCAFTADSSALTSASEDEPSEPAWGPRIVRLRSDG